jgi:hypothetical protein
VRSRPADSVLKDSPRGTGRGRSILRVCAAVLALGVAFSPEAALSLEAQARASEENGYARMVLRFDQMPQVETRLSNNILTLTFSEPVTVPVDKLALSIANYVSVARRDPDGKALRFALSKRVTVRSMAAGERLFIDLLPEGWVGEPPALPDDVIEELTKKAREVEKMKREEAARRALAKPTPITIRAARQPTFSRLTFDLTSPVPVAVERKGDDVTVTFDAALTADTRPLKAELPPQLRDVKIDDKDARLKVTLSVAKGSDVRAFWDGVQYVIDLTGAGEAQKAPDLAATLAEAAAQAAPPKPNEGETLLQGGQAEVAPPVTAPAEEAPTPPAPRPSASAEEKSVPNPPSKEKTAEESPKALPEEEAQAAQASPQGSSGDEKSTVAAAMTAAETPAPGEPKAGAPEPESKVVAQAKPAAEATKGATVSADAAGDPIRPIIQTVGDTVRIAFPFDRKTPGAVYRRGDNLWIVFDTDREIDAAPLSGESPVLAGAEAFTSDGAKVVKLSMKKPPLTTVSPDGSAWIVSIGDQILDGAVPVPLQRGVQPDGRTLLYAPLEGVGSIHRIKDTDIGDEVIVATAAAPARAFLKPQDFVEFQTLVTAHGLAFLPKADDIIVAAELDRVVVSRDSGLTLSSATASASKPAATTEKRIALIDTAQWEKEKAQPFRERERELLHAVADATDREATPLRLALARFYLAKGFGAEAAGTLELALRQDSNIGRDPEFAILSAAAHVALGQGAQATQLLADNGLSDSADGALWRSLADASEHKWGSARETFQKGVAAIDLYPADLQAPFRLAAYEAALEAKDPADADAQRLAFEALGVEYQPAHKALLDARLAEQQGRQSEALEAYRVAIEGTDAIASAEARLRSITLRRELGQVDDKAVRDELETLAAVWRGDEIEADTIKALAEEHLREGRYREAFGELKTALVHHPKSEATRALQALLTEKFVALFLDGEADSMPPIDALALFYDYRELTPVDRRGDEMIRKLADRLFDVDLLDQAAELLQHQVDNRLSGAGRSQVAARLAMIQLLNRKPTLALKTLASTRQANLPRELVKARLILEARALAETARPDLAIEILEQIESEESARLRADVLWQARRWRDAGEAIETLLGSAWEGAAPLTDDQRLQTMRAAIAYSLAEDKIGLDRLRTKFSAKMANSADAASFETVSAPIDARGTAFRDIAKQIASSDTLDAFIKEYRARHDTPPEGTTPEPKPGQTKPSANAEPEKPVAGG